MLAMLSLKSRQENNKRELLLFSYLCPFMRSFTLYVDHAITRYICHTSQCSTTLWYDIANTLSNNHNVVYGAITSYTTCDIFFNLNIRFYDNKNTNTNLLLQMLSEIETKLWNPKGCNISRNICVVVLPFCVLCFQCVSQQLSPLQYELGNWGVHSENLHPLSQAGVVAMGMCPHSSYKVPHNNNFFISYTYNILHGTH